MFAEVTHLIKWNLSYNGCYKEVMH